MKGMRGWQEVKKFRHNTWEFYMTSKLNKREMLYLFLTYTQPPGPLTCSLTLDPMSSDGLLYYIIFK